jgi:hypothetical protein
MRATSPADASGSPVVKLRYDPTLLALPVLPALVLLNIERRVVMRIAKRTTRL